MSKMEFHGECPPQIEQARDRHNHDRFTQLNGLVTSHVDGTWQYLLAVNGGGAATALTFIGAVDRLRGLTWPYVVLSIFVLGLVLVGLGRAFMVHWSSNLVEGWIADTGAYFRGQVSWFVVIKRDEDRVNRWRAVPWILGWAAFVMFLLGVGLAAFKLHAGI